MRTGSSLNTYPVFPDWVFTGKMQLDDQIASTVLSEIKASARTDYGFATPAGKMTQGIYNLTRLVGTLFYDIVVPHFQLSGEQRNIESVDAQVLHIRPGKCVPHSVKRHRWYRSAVFLQCDVGSSDIYLDMMDGKLHCTPPNVQETLHKIVGEQFRVAFWPAHIPWGFTYNHSNTDTVVFTSTFIIKKTE